MAHTSLILALWPAFLILFITLPLAYSSSPAPPSTEYAAYESAPAPPPTESPSPVSSATSSMPAFPPYPPLRWRLSHLHPRYYLPPTLERDLQARAGYAPAPPICYLTDEPYNGAPVPPSPYAPISADPLSSSCAPPSAHVKFDPGVGHDGASPPSSSSSSNSSSPNHETVGYDRGKHRTEEGWSREWVTGVDGSGMGVQSMNDVAKRLRGLRLR
ncbi:hypothetical protein C8R44DRAFT_747715 [Mycena epipterygia]|nr:hypothetical protein C8R44DRAFT_747715 [Mycena epipterygia]